MTTSSLTEPGYLASLATRPVGEIAARLPGATAVFRAYGIDFCCRGSATLSEAARARSLPEDEIAERLRRLSPDAATAPEETVALIDHILRRYHEKHRRDLPELVTLAHRVEKAHRNHPDVPRGLAGFLERMGASLESHMFKEELILFPALRHGARMGLDFPLAQMRHEHDGHGADLRELATLTRDGIVPDGACPTWKALYAGTRALADELMEHIHLENNVLFARFERVGE